MKHFLSALEQNEPLDWPALRQQLIKQGVSANTVDQVFKAARGSDRLWHVSIIDQPAFNALLDHLGVSQQTDTSVPAVHQAPTQAGSNAGNIVVVKHPEYPFPVAYECDPAGRWHYPSNPSDDLIIIENMACFLQREQLLQFISSRCGVFTDITRTDIAYAAGNEITRACNKSWLAQYGSVYCVFDANAAGLRMFESLRRLLSDSPVDLVFVIPRELESVLDREHQSLDDDERQSVTAYCQSDAPTGLIAQTILSMGKPLKQEMYLEGNG